VRSSVSVHRYSLSWIQPYSTLRQTMRQSATREFRRRGRRRQPFSAAANTGRIVAHSRGWASPPYNRQGLQKWMFMNGDHDAIQARAHHGDAPVASDSRHAVVYLAQDRQAGYARSPLTRDHRLPAAPPHRGCGGQQLAVNRLQAPPNLRLIRTLDRTSGCQIAPHGLA